MEELEFKVGRENIGERVDKFLVEKLKSQLSRSQIQKLIEKGYLWINGNLIKKPSYKVKLGDTIVFKVILDEVIEEYNCEPEEIPIDVIYEDNYLLVVNKPAGIVIHPSRGHPKHTLVNALLYHTKENLGGGDKIRPGIVHRLDKDTTGVIVVTKDPKVHEILSNQFKRHDVHRIYHAIVYGRVLPEVGRIETFFGRHPKNRFKFSSKVSSGKIAITNYRVISYFEGANLSLMELRLETGRTHQIRVHLSDIGHPVLGDPLYGGRKRGNKIIERVLNILRRQALHASELGFIHPITGNFRIYKAELPSDMREVISLLGWG